ncbi:class I adenylate cyclase [Oceaniserpentilla sp. 4NH20-0058]|uniref:class I adenylate cyclase n=1 Tax=Oceaniserpentilla sp. 4NH20-0058 TaxID=3127660 RepID=UPI003106B3F3
MSELTKGAKGFDRDLAMVVVKRFLTYNQYRLERTQQALSERQRVLLDVIGLLYHVNHEKLPGFVGEDCPCGVARYTPTKDTLRAAASITTGFQYSQRRRGQPFIKSLFIMGSCGSLGHSGGSDLDIWLCHEPSLTGPELAVLQKKSTAIEKWADNIGLEVHFFLMDAQKFVNGERNDLDGEDCGSAQHHLLLDEFYRTSILLCGCYPLWWLVPVEHEDNYEDFAYRLQDQGFVNRDEVVDFGGIGSIPAGEFVGAGMWQLYKAIGSPYKSILKLFLTEAYANGYPEVRALSLDLKNRIFNEQTELDKLDPYLLLYDRLEAYLLTRDEISRLELVRRCIYFKANIPMGQSNRRKHWKRDFLRPVIKEWGWPDGLLLHLDNRPQWQVHTVDQERKSLVNELIHSYKFLSQFGRQYQNETLLTAKDMTLLGHKLYATFDRKPGKIDLINPGISKDIQEEKLSLHLNRQHVRRRIPQMAWSLFTGIARLGGAQNPIKKSASLIELLAWSHVNKVMARGTNVVMYQGRQHGQDYELKEIINSFYQTPLVESIEAHFEEPPVPRLISLYINVFVDPMSHYTRKGIHKISNRTDSLGYSALKENLVLTIDQLVYNSWREVLVTRYEGQNALLRVIEDYLMSYPPTSTQAPPDVHVHCFCITRPKAIAERVELVMKEVQRCFYGSKLNARRRYVLQIGSEYHLIQFNNGRPVIYHHEKPVALFRQLSKPQKYYSQIVLDSHALKGSVMDKICSNLKSGVLQVYYLRKEQKAHIYVIDERGSLIQWRTPIYNEAALINPLNHFLRQVEYRQNRHRYGENETVQQRDIEYFEVVLPSKQEGLSLRPIRPKEGLGQGRYFDVFAQVDFDANDELGFTLQCDQEDFSQMEYGDQVYKALVRHLVKLRQHHKPYPVYITDIAISDRLHQRNGNQVLQTCSYLDYKFKLEQRLNNALAELYPENPQDS